LEGTDPAAQPRNALFTIGWIGTPPNARYLNPIAPALAEVAAQGRARLAAVGARKRDLAGVPSEIRPWSVETEVREIQSFDAGIMPLPDNPFERGKCAFKLLQYFSCGRAAVASPVGVNAKIVEHGVNGFLASSVGEWKTALSALRDDPALRRRLGAAGRATVERDFDAAKIAPRLAALLREAAG
jgi:glycosyltransferase involved in cell wall biosynthesis